MPLAPDTSRSAFDSATMLPETVIVPPAKTLPDLKPRGSLTKTNLPAVESEADDPICTVGRAF